MTHSEYDALQALRAVAETRDQWAKVLARPTVRQMARKSRPNLFCRVMARMLSR